MKVLTIVNDLGPGGTQRVAVDVTLCYQRHGHQCAVLTYNGSGPRLQELDDAGIQTFIAKHKRNSNPNTTWNTAARDWNPDIIHFHRSGKPTPDENALIRFLKDPPHQQAPASNPDQTKPIRVIEHSHFGRCDRTKDRHLIDAHIQISKWCLWRWRTWAKGLKPQPVGAYIPHMVNADKFTVQSNEQAAQLRENHSIPQDAFLYGFIAQPNYAKWSPNLFNSFKAVAQSDSNTYLMIAGISDKSKELYARFPDEIKSRIIVLPFIKDQQDISTAYTAMDAFVHATRIGETFGFILTESMCCNTPVLTMETPERDNAQAEIVGHKRGGLVAANQKELVRAMLKIKEDKELYAHCKAHGREHVINEFNQERISNMLIRFLDHVYSSTNREDLRTKLAADPLLITSISKFELDEASLGRMGSHTLKQRILQTVVLTPTFQRVWRVLCGS
ncbi:MAG: glycosyltransferase family 4 protein [Phycisphaerales bacterium]